MKTLLRALLILALIVSAGICFWDGRDGVETDLYALVGGGSEVVASLAQSTANQFRILCDTPAEVAACRAVASFDEPVDPQAFFELIRTKGAGLLSEKHRALLSAGETNRIVRSALRRDYAGVGLLPKADDPYYFLNDFVLSLKAFRPQLKAGQVLLTGRVGPGGVAPKAIGDLLELARCLPGIHLSGAPFHAFRATEEAKGEIGWFGAFSLAAVFVIGLFLFRGTRFVLPLVIALGCGLLVGSAALFLLPGKPHVLTLLFGTTLIGLGVDYCYHGLSRAETRLVRKLSSALATTCLAFAPLLFSSVAVLNQMAVFTMAGLLAIYACVTLFFIRTPRRLALDGDEGTTVGWRAWSLPLWMRRVVGLAFGGIVVFGLSRLNFSNDPASLHRMDPQLQASEQVVAEATGLSKLKFSPVPLEDWQRENFQLKQQLGATPPGAFLSAADLPAFATVMIDGRAHLLLPDENGLDLKDELAKMFETLAGETYRLLVVSLGLMLLGIVLFARRRAGAYLRPLGMTLLATAGVLGLGGIPVNFFQLLCGFILVGLAIDYVVFHLDGGGSGTVLASFLTSFIGFGLLGFTSFPVTRFMGLTLAVGLLFAYFLSYPSAKAACSRGAERTGGKGWFRQSEQSAGRIRLVLMWWIYRWLGKSFAKVVTFFVVLFVYPFAAVGRRAVRENLAKLGTGPAGSGEKASVFAVFLNFAWSMLDKTDACSLKKNLPQMTLDGDTGWLKGGCFLLATHIGCIEVLPALRASSNVQAFKGSSPSVHAFQQLGHDAMFTELFLKYLDRGQMTLHAVEEIGVETAVEMKEAIDRGDIVLMAGDRPSATATATLSHRFFGHVCQWPKGVFRFAKLMECPVYAITCVKTGWNAYTVRSRRLGAELLADYVAFLEAEVRANPEQWYQFYPVFAREAAAAKGGERS